MYFDHHPLFFPSDLLFPVSTSTSMVFVCERLSESSRADKGALLWLLKEHGQLTKGYLYKDVVPFPPPPQQTLPTSSPGRGGPSGDP